ncbi:hypothetical protein [Alkalihalobacillus sp. BA299]|uniref:hypothetical protein n=1 Tax=Alkalihalobacillus sp. BA299 TaxID=2815938 RepID=UPI001AD9CC82|nr:hypothetical protein [Alkalihalobacillus sp. BA299]
MFNNNTNLNFPFFQTANAEASVKNAHDTYDIFVNRHFVGQKVLLTDNESLDDVLDFLQKQGVDNVTAHLDGDHYVIQSQSEKDIEHITNVLSTYLDNH